MASLALTGSYTYFGVEQVTAHFPADLPLVIAAGVLGGAAGGLFSKLVLMLTRRLRRRWLHGHAGAKGHAGGRGGRVDRWPSPGLPPAG